MDEGNILAERFEAHRPHLRAVAYRMLGSLSEADDAVQESWIHLSRSGAARRPTGSTRSPWRREGQRAAIRASPPPGDEP